MPLQQKTRLSGRRIIITPPRQIMDAYYINNSDFLEIVLLQRRGILIKTTAEELVR